MGAWSNKGLYFDEKRTGAFDTGKDHGTGTWITTF
jgi:hypothetical protein